MDVRFCELENMYYILRRKIKTVEYINPINLQEEKSKFIDYINKGRIYNPIFKYNANNYTLYLAHLKEIRTLFLEQNHIFSQLYISTINQTIDWIKEFEGKNDNFSDWLSSLYGKPDKQVLSQAYYNINNYIFESNDNRELTPNDVKPRIEKTLSDYKFKDWNIEIKKMSARMSVNNLLQTVNINKNALFSETELNRLVIHEIGTHVLRGENGKKQSSLLFRYGFPNYIETEEGLAINSEHLTNYSSLNDMLLYSLRTIACDLSFKFDFYNIFREIQKYVDLNTAFDIVARIKRGLTYTSSLGGYTKDQVYLSGYLKVKALDKKTLRKLYIGKIGIDDINLIEKSGIEINDYIIPEWFAR